MRAREFMSRMREADFDMGAIKPGPADRISPPTQPNLDPVPNIKGTSNLSSPKVEPTFPPGDEWLKNVELPPEGPYKQRQDKFSWQDYKDFAKDVGSEIVKGAGNLAKNAALGAARVGKVAGPLGVIAKVMEPVELNKGEDEALAMMRAKQMPQDNEPAPAQPATNRLDSFNVFKK